MSPIGEVVMVGGTCWELKPAGFINWGAMYPRVRMWSGTSIISLIIVDVSSTVQPRCSSPSHMYIHYISIYFIQHFKVLPFWINVLSIWMQIYQLNKHLKTHNSFWNAFGTFWGIAHLKGFTSLCSWFWSLVNVMRYLGWWGIASTRLSIHLVLACLQTVHVFSIVHKMVLFNESPPFIIIKGDWCWLWQTVKWAMPLTQWERFLISLNKCIYSVSLACGRTRWWRHLWQNALGGATYAQSMFAHFTCDQSRIWLAYTLIDVLK